MQETANWKTDLNLPSFEERNLQVYPQCAVILDSLKRYECCDKAVLSSAGRQFCYNDIVYPEDEFSECQLQDVIKNFECCDQLAKGDLNYAYECKLASPAPGY